MELPEVERNPVMEMMRAFFHRRELGQLRGWEGEVSHVRVSVGEGVEGRSWREGGVEAESCFSAFSSSGLTPPGMVAVMR